MYSYRGPLVSWFGLFKVQLGWAHFKGLVLTERWGLGEFGWQSLGYPSWVIVGANVVGL